MTFGIASAISGLVGALLQIWLHSIVLSYVLGILLVFAGVTGITELRERMRFGRTTGWIAGMLSGVFGGLVGNQGGIRSAALLGYDMSKESFVATATAIALPTSSAANSRCNVYRRTGAWVLTVPPRWSLSPQTRRPTTPTAAWSA